MTLPLGDITVGMVAVEIGASLPLNLGDSRVRALAGVASGPINLGQLRGKTFFNPTLSSARTSVVVGPISDRWIQWTVTVTCNGATAWTWSLSSDTTPPGIVGGSDQGGGVYRVTWAEPFEVEGEHFGTFTVTCAAGNGATTKTLTHTGGI